MTFVISIGPAAIQIVSISDLDTARKDIKMPEVRLLVLAAIPLNSQPTITLANGVNI